MGDFQGHVCQLTAKENHQEGLYTVIDISKSSSTLVMFVVNTSVLLRVIDHMI